MNELSSLSVDMSHLKGMEHGIELDFDFDEWPKEKRRPIKDILGVMERSQMGYDPEAWVVGTERATGRYICVEPHFKHCYLVRWKQPAARPPANHTNSQELEALLNGGVHVEKDTNGPKV